MKGIYLTEEGKQELESKIAELAELSTSKETMSISYIAKHSAYSLILQSATILPVEESLNDIPISVLMAKQNLSEYYPNGVIILPKQ
jgi:hypothetical protein